MKKIKNIAFVFIIGLYVFMSVSFCGINNVKALTSNNNLILSQSKEINEEKSEKNIIEEPVDEDEIFSYRLKLVVLILITSLLLTHIQRYKKYKVVKKYKEVENTTENIMKHTDNQYDIMDVKTSDEEENIIDNNVINNIEKTDEIEDTVKETNRTNNSQGRNTNRQKNINGNLNNNKTRRPNNNTNRNNKSNRTSNRNSNKNSNKSNYNSNRKSK